MDQKIKQNDSERLARDFNWNWTDFKTLLKALVDSSDDAIISKTLVGIILRWNYGAEVIYGYAAQEVEGRSIPILVPDGYPDELSQILKRIS